MDETLDWEIKNTNERDVVLASASPRRKELLRQAGITFRIIISNVKETITKTNPDEVVEELSFQKAQAVAGRIEKGILVIGADTVVALEGKILGKPENEADAARMLKSLQGRCHHVYTGVTFYIRKGTREAYHTFSECTEVEMYPMSDKEIREYIATGEPMDKAGAYGIQGRAGVFVKRICGDYNNVVGLPIARLYQEMKKFKKL